MLHALKKKQLHEFQSIYGTQEVYQYAYICTVDYITDRLRSILNHGKRFGSSTLRWNKSNLAIRTGRFDPKRNTVCVPRHDLQAINQQTKCHYSGCSWCNLCNDIVCLDDISDYVQEKGIGMVGVSGGNRSCTFPYSTFRSSAPRKQGSEIHLSCQGSRCTATNATSPRERTAE